MSVRHVPRVCCSKQKKEAIEWRVRGWRCVAEARCVWAFDRVGAAPVSCWGHRSVPFLYPCNRIYPDPWKTGIHYITAHSISFSNIGEEHLEEWYQRFHAAIDPLTNPHPRADEHTFLANDSAWPGHTHNSWAEEGEEGVGSAEQALHGGSGKEGSELGVWRSFGELPVFFFCPPGFKAFFSSFWLLVFVLVSFEAICRRWSMLVYCLYFCIVRWCREGNDCLRAWVWSEMVRFFSV